MKEKEKFDINEFWPQAEKMLDRHFRLKRLFRIIGFSSLVVFSFIAAWIFIPSTSQKSNTIVQNQMEILNKPNINSPKNNKDNFSTPSNNQSNIDAVESIKNESIKSSKNDYVKPNQESSSKKVTTLLAPTKTKKNTKEITQNKDIKSNSESNTKKNNYAQIPKSVYAESPERKSLNEQKKESQRNTTIFASPLNELSQNGTNSPAKETEIAIAKFTFSQMKSLGAYPLSIELSNNPSLKNEILRNTLLQNKKLFWSVFFQTGIFNTQKSLLGNSTNEEYVNRRKSQEKSNLVYNLGVGTKIWYNKFALNVGVDYSNFSEKTNYENWKYGYNYSQKDIWNFTYNTQTYYDTIYYQGISYNLPYSITKKDSTKTLVVDSAYGKVYSEGNVIANGKTLLSYVEFPLLMEYNFVFHKFSIALQAGISPGLASFRKGYYINPMQDNYILLAESNDFRKWIWNARTGVSINYKIGNGIEVFMQPQYRVNLTSVYKSSFGVSQKYTSIGTSLGLLVWF